MVVTAFRNLVSGGRLPFFFPEAEGRIERAYLEPQPDDAVPRFDYETHVRALIVEDEAGRKAYSDPIWFGLGESTSGPVRH